MAETLKEFDQPSPLPFSYCQQIPSEEFDRRSAHTTKDALQTLINHLEVNPEEFYKILRRKKADNLKFLQFVKVKALSKFQEGYLEKCFPDVQCREDLENLTREMASAFNYAQDGKRTGVRFSRRLADKQKLGPLKTSTPKKPTAPPPPPPPPPPITPASDMSTLTLNNTRLTRSVIHPGTPSGTFRHEEKLIQSIRDVPARRKLHEKNSARPVTSKCSSSHEEISSKMPRLSSISIDDLTATKNSLRVTRPTGSPEDSPYTRCKLQKENQTPCEEDNFSMFNMELLRKFQNAHSPSDSTSPSGKIINDSVFDSPN